MKEKQNQKLIADEERMRPNRSIDEWKRWIGYGSVNQSIKSTMTLLYLSIILPEQYLMCTMYACDQFICSNKKDDGH